MKKSTKFYEFAKESKFSRAVEMLFSCVVFTFLTLVIYLIFKSLFLKVVDNSINFRNLNCFFIIMCFVLGIFLSVWYNRSLKGILLNDSYFKIETNFILKNHLFKINPKICYGKIKSVQLESKKSENYQKWNEKHLFIIAGYHSSTNTYVRVETVNGSIYCFCVENQEKFVKELVDRVNDYRKNHNMQEL